MIRNQLVRALEKLLLPHVRPLTYKEHAAIVHAIERRDPEKARDAMYAHLHSSLLRHKGTPGKQTASRAKAPVAVKSRRTPRAAPGVDAPAGSQPD